MRFLRRIHPAILMLFITSYIGGMLVSSACTKSQRTDTIRVAILSVNAARDGLIEFDRQHQIDLVDHATSREDAQAKLAAYRAERNKTLQIDDRGDPQVFVVVYQALAFAAVENDQPSLTAALKMAKEVVDAIGAFKSEHNAKPGGP